MLKFNTFRAKRYLRSKFVEGRYLLASEASDIELEMLDLLRRMTESTVGDVAIDNAWKVQRLNSTQLLVSPGEAWYKGLPIDFRTGKDQLVSGSILSAGILPVGVSIADDANGLGKILTFNNAATTPTNLYRIVITAKEQLITETDDQFLRNANLSESTAQKLRLVLQINVVPDSLQSASPVPYRDENSTQLVTTNFPSVGGLSSPNLANEIEVTPTSGGNGELISTTLISGSERIDGRDVEIVLRNNTALGGGHPIPKNTTEQQAFSNGKLVDSNGTVYHVNAIFNDVVSTQVVIRIDKEPSQPNPEIVNTKPFTLMKRDVYATDDVNGLPQGKLFWPIATANWDTSNNFVHDSTIVDLRNVRLSDVDYQNKANQKMDLTVTGGTTISYGITAAQVLTWGSDFELVNAFGPIQTVAANDAAMLDGGSLVYELDLENGGSIDRGTLAVTILSSGSTITVSGGDDLSSVRVGNVIKRSAELSQVISIDNVNKQIEVSPSISTTGSAMIYLDSFAPQTAKLTENSYVLAVMHSNKAWLAGGSLELEDGESGGFGDGISDQNLTFMGATSELDDSPLYSSTTVVTQGSSLVTAIGALDAEDANINAALNYPVYDERLTYPAGLPASTNITLPNNSRNFSDPQYYIIGEGKLQIYLNQLYKMVTVDYLEVDPQTIKFNYALPANAEVHFRIATIGGAAGSVPFYYDESLYYASGLVAGTTITLPASQTYSNSLAKDIIVFVNGRAVEVTRDFTVVGSGPFYSQIQFIYDLPADSVVRFKIV